MSFLLLMMMQQMLLQKKAKVEVRSKDPRSAIQTRLVSCMWQDNVVQRV